MLTNEGHRFFVLGLFIGLFIRLFVDLFVFFMVLTGI